MIHRLFFDGIKLHCRSFAVDQRVERAVSIFPVPAKTSFSFSNCATSETEAALYSLLGSLFIESGFFRGEYRFGVKVANRASKTKNGCRGKTGFEK
jgi:hypothetical protein